MTTKKRKYPILKQGDKVAIMAPAYGVHDRDLRKIESYIKSIGLEPFIPEGFMSGDLIASATEEVRFEQLKYALESDDIKAIWCVKGGSGSPQLIPYLEKMDKPKNEKLFIAFSDNTSIHFFLNQKWGWQTLHAPILWQIVRERIDKRSIEQVENIIFGRDYKNNFDLQLISDEAPTKKITSEAIIGGNLKLVQCSIGTSWEIESKNKILLFEDINEKPYQLDRIFTHILQSNLLDGADAIIFGDFEGGDIDIEADLVDKLLKRFSTKVKCPVFRTEGIGHTETNWAVHFGVESTIEKDDNGNFYLEIAKI
jgi:muramoyltetrapeptide carboxypeptidase